MNSKSFLFIFISAVHISCQSASDSKDSQKIYGTYVSANGKFDKVEFGKSSDGFDKDKNAVTLGGMSTTYKIDGKEIVIAAPPSMGGDVFFQIIDDNKIKGENGDTAIYTRQ